ncbi:hypothetical protein [Paralysiella testudinis]|uniref:Uncharacterized protein n=1 Tax=Paralysiella testudinis TaxID=2809020 RepID=A0A892ZEH2_9NEIS|nr:hypothetical protein [Paralysiella testudinis]QRQ81795.1 hypothetical protein JQU52_14185 [Paralysiella testudinis]
MNDNTQTTNTQVSNQSTQGFYIEASFDRIVRKEKKDREGKIVVNYEVAVIVRTEQDTNIYNIKTKNPEAFKGFKPGQPLRVRIMPRAFKDFLYFTIVE